jgi:hypothetical protein
VLMPHNIFGLLMEIQRQSITMFRRDRSSCRSV